MNKQVSIPKAQYTNTLTLNQNRSIGLDVARAMCVILVVLAHTNNYMKPFTGAYKYIFPIGSMMQDLFFGLSGYLVGTQIVKQINSSGKFFNLLIFYKNRWVRTIPFYLIFLGINFLMFHFIYKHSGLDYFNSNFNVKDYVFFIQNFSDRHPTFFPEIWPLPIEEWSFLLLPIPILVLVSIFKKPLTKKQLIALLLVEMILVNAVRVNHIIGATLQTDWDLRKVVVYRFDALIYGFLVSLLMDEYKDFFFRHKGKLLLIAFPFCFVFYLSYSILDLKIYQALLFFILPLFMSLGIPFFYFQSFEKFKTKLVAMLTHLSLISYSVLLSHLYLIQFSLLVIYTPQSFTEGILFTLIYFSILLAFATVFFNLVERPILLLRKK
jgi:peptidoglycan/LPS O-acetylase OafA/YrhL